MSTLNTGVFARPSWPDKVINKRFRYLSDYFWWIGGLVVLQAIQAGINVTDLEGDAATRHDFENQLQGVDPIFVFIASHGIPGAIKGQGGADLVSSQAPNPNHDLLEHRVSYIVACYSGGILGSDIINAGGLALLGFEDQIFVDLVEGDDTDRAIAESFSGAATVLFAGGTVGDAAKRLKDGFKYWEGYWQKKRLTKVRTDMLYCLRVNQRAIKELGASNTKIIA